MFTTDEIKSKYAGPQARDDVKYEFMSARALRGTEARTISKWEKAGWELDTQQQGTLRTEMTFRRVKPKNAWQQCVAFLAEHWAAFGRLKSTTQQGVLAASGALVVLAVVVAVVVASGSGGGTSELTAAPTEAAELPSSEQPSEAPTSPESEPESEAYVYQGPQYEIVAIDENLGPARQTQYWVLTSPFDYSTDEYKNQVRMIIEDIAHQNGTASLFVAVVTDREVAEAEAASTYESFVEEHGIEYVFDTISAKEGTHWAATYWGGFDHDTQQASQAAEAFEVLWRPYATEELEQWRPALAG